MSGGRKKPYLAPSQLKAKSSLAVGRIDEDWLSGDAEAGMIARRSRHSFQTWTFGMMMQAWASLLDAG